MAQGKMKIKSKVPAASSKTKRGNPKKELAVQRRGNAPVKPKKTKLVEANRLRKIVTKTVNRAMEDDLREKALEGKKSLTKKAAPATSLGNHKPKP